MDLLRKVVANALLCAALALPLAPHARAERPPLKVTGFGLLGNAELRNALRLLEFQEATLDERKISDGAFLLLTRLKQNGYLDAQVNATLYLENDDTVNASWSGDFEPQIERELVAQAVEYHIEPGQLYYYDSIEIDGLQSIETDTAKSYFIPDTALYLRKQDKAYSPNILSSQQKQLISALNSMGRADARVAEQSVDIDRDTGAVDASLVIEEGPLYRVVQTEVAYFRSGEQTDLVTEPADAIYSRFWIEDQIRALRNESYRNGFPDTKVSSRIANSERVDGQVRIAMRFEIERGKKVTLSSVEHRGADDTHTPLLERKADLQPGQPLDITNVEAARRRLSRLGVFKRIDLSYEQTGPGERKAIFNYTPGNRLRWQLLAGYGSYESFRIGVIGRRNNLFGRAHTASFEAVQSVKSTTGKLNYKVPEILGESINGSLEASFLDRQELYFDRTERGVSIGLSTRLPRRNTDLSLDYAFDRKRSSESEVPTARRTEDTNIGSIALRATRSTVDNILYPTDGYEVFAAVRYAAEALGGETEFTRPEVGAAYHARLGDRWIFHAAAKGAMIASPGENRVVIPFGEFFIVGGENTLRGFRRGEAGPIDQNGDPTSAQAYALANVELEYPLFDRLNVVFFTDAARVWESTGYFDIYDDFVNVGIGLRYNTIVGPVRLEYGHNVVKRDVDPDGTLHLSIGFPF